MKKSSIIQWVKKFIKERKKVSIFLCVLFCILLISVTRSIFASDTSVYMTAVVKRGDIEESVLVSGIVRPHKLVAVGARTTGRVAAMHVVPGDVVKKGDLLAEIDATDEENDLKRKKAVLAHYNARLQEQESYLFQAQANLDRQRQMIERHATSKVTFDEAEVQVGIRKAQLAQLKEQITQAQIDVNSAEANLSYTRIEAPLAGTVLATIIEEGQNVNAVQSVPTVAILGDLSKMKITMQISEADILRVHAGQPLYFTVLGNIQRRYEGTLERVDPAPESIRADIGINPGLSGSTSSLSSSAVYYNGLVHVDNSDGFLRTYMTAQARIILNSAQDVLLVPSDALHNETKDNKAWVQILVGANKVVTKQVVVGINNRTMAEIVSGINEGDVVIIGSRDASTTVMPSDLNDSDGI
ncbi:efflux RND transporter periplasmic adaptor subunit [Bartonella ancashensis]|uniref:Macrolide-specific efflux protein MacA n=1 Tax=Bartonella ancashensis TaxID=1318743 RepID=A0A0M3T2R1_9HYPH|nr:efflux RND transporter periplasmic adaptor subunit [Bartonella ancashensis]ALE03175.1 Macrolide-specific efflux protein MacA [Bartonella ancashensis]